ncbi:hypothetical protein BD413DRAFT_88675 [Trametes elegans]|nr:hypothetical protein BD413DRAFT_88675 [Trametes elegans]
MVIVRQAYLRVGCAMMTGHTKKWLRSLPFVFLSSLFHRPSSRRVRVRRNIGLPCAFGQWHRHVPSAVGGPMNERFWRPQVCNTMQAHSAAVLQAVKIDDDLVRTLPGPTSAPCCLGYTEIPGGKALMLADESSCSTIPTQSTRQGGGSKT